MIQVAMRLGVGALIALGGEFLMLVAVGIHGFLRLATNSVARIYLMVPHL